MPQALLHDFKGYWLIYTMDWSETAMVISYKRPFTEKTRHTCKLCHTHQCIRWPSNSLLFLTCQTKIFECTNKKIPGLNVKYMRVWRPNQKFYCCCLYKSFSMPCLCLCLCCLVAVYMGYTWEAVTLLAIATFPRATRSVSLSPASLIALNALEWRNSMPVIHIFTS